MTQTRDTKTIRRTFYVVAFLLAAAVIVATIASFTNLGSSGRDFRPHLALLALVLFPAATMFRYFGRWPWSSLVAGLVLVEFLALLIVGFFSGSTGRHLFSAFNLQWLSFISFFLALPWMAGAAIGEAFIRVKLAQRRG